MSLSLKPTMTSEFHDAMSTASENVSASSSQDENNYPLQVQPTTTNEWHDTIQSPTAAGPSFDQSVDSDSSSDDDTSSTDNDLHKFSKSFDESCEVE